MKLPEKHGGGEVNDLCFSFPPFAQNWPSILSQSVDLSR